MDISRRSFLRGALTVAALAVVSLPAVETHPVLFGDGEHDDTEALNALFAGQPVFCEANLILSEMGQPVWLRGGQFKVSSTVFVRGNASVHDCIFVAKGLPGPVLYFASSARFDHIRVM